MMSNPTNGNGGDATIILSFTYSNGWPGSIEIPNVSAATLGGKLASITQALESAGCRPPAPLAAPATAANAPTNGGYAAPPAGAASEPRFCPHHGKELKPSKKPGTLFCTAKTGDNSYCTYTLEI